MRVAILAFPLSPPVSRSRAVFATTVRTLADQLQRRSHQISVNASGQVAETGIAAVFEHADDFDLIHSFAGAPALTYARLVSTPLLATVTREMWQAAPEIFRAYSDRVFFAAPDPGDITLQARGCTVVPWGIDVERIDWRAKPEGHLAFAGELTRNGGAALAIDLAKRVGLPLVVVGPASDREFFASRIGSHLNGDRVRWIEDGAGEQADAAIGSAIALLHTGDSKGELVLTLLDAMARGTPVVFLGAHGAESCVLGGIASLPCETIEQASDALAAVYKLDRATCRDAIVQLRGADAMVSAYESLYERTIAGQRRLDRRPWGYYVVLADEPDHKVKRIVVYPGKRLSLQRHSKRSEHWYVVKGEAVVTRNDDTVRLVAGQSVDIPATAWHRIQNCGTSDMAFVEVQTGEYFGEDDIERKEDDFGRT